MNRKRGGTKRSSWHTFRRRLLLVRLLLRSSMSREHLIAAVQQELGSEGYPEAAESALKHDLDSLKREYGCGISFKRSTGLYTLDDLGELALLELPDHCMEALSFLDASFPAGSALPEHANIRALLERVVRLLPTARQDELQHSQGSIVLDLAGRVPNRIDRTVLVTLKRAIAHRQEVAFDYMGLHDLDQPRHHRVAPYRVFFRPEGHGYLDATLLEAQPPGKEAQYTAIDYRLDRILPGTVKVLPAMLPPQRIPPPTYTLRYCLHPAVARRRDVATYFPQTHIDYHEDGSATVTAVVTNLWQTRQILLRYGTGCCVLEPPELVELFREAAFGMAQMYAEMQEGAPREQERG
jgi:predicted DNA-binding transcriptional regulator YafY